MSAWLIRRRGLVRLHNHGLQCQEAGRQPRLIFQTKLGFVGEGIDIQPAQHAEAGIEHDQGQRLMFIDERMTPVADKIIEEHFAGNGRRVGHEGADLPGAVVFLQHAAVRRDDATEEAKRGLSDWDDHSRLQDAMAFCQHDPGALQDDVLDQVFGINEIKTCRWDPKGARHVQRHDRVPAMGAGLGIHVCRKLSDFAIVGRANFQTIRARAGRIGAQRRIDTVALLLRR